MLNQNTTAHHPDCVKCRKRMARNPKVYGGVCIWIQDERKRDAARRRKFGVPITDPDAMLRDIDSHLAGYSTDMREELRQEIALAILNCAVIEGRLISTADDLTPAAIKAIARPLFKSQPNRFRDVSLDHQYGEDGQRLEDRLVG